MASSRPTGGAAQAIPDLTWRQLVAPIVLAALAGAAVGAAVGAFPDLHVYRYAGRSVLEQWPAYQFDDPVTGYPLTYPPFAAVPMVPLALLPGWLAAALWTGASAGSLAATVMVVRRALGNPLHWWQVALVVVGALAVEPVWQNFAFGQVNLILMLAILVDLIRPERRMSGVLVGLAAGVKLTPLVFIVLLALVGHRRAAGRATIAFAATVALGLVAFPGAPSYWTGRLLDPARVGPSALTHNQSVSGALARLLESPPSTLLWMAVAGPVAAAIVLVARSWWLRGDRVLGTCLGAMAMLLASPIAWSHHWVWAVPVALALWEHGRPAAALWAGVFVARPILWPPWGEGREHGWRWYEHCYGNAYVLAALALAVAMGAALRRIPTAGTRSDRTRRH